MTKVAADLRARAVKGEDPDKLQKEAYAAAGLPGNAPNTKMEKVRGTTLPANHRAVMDLKPGEVSEVISDPNGASLHLQAGEQGDLVSGYCETGDSQPDFQPALSREHAGFSGRIDLNDAYFGPSRNPAMPIASKGSKAACSARTEDSD